MKVKIQHFVPQFYLNYFSSVKDQIWVYDKSERKKFESSIKNIACEKYFYDDDELDQLSGESQLVEKFFSYFESEIAPIYKSLVERIESSDNYQITEEDRNNISSLIEIQISRTKEYREEISQLSHEVRSQLKAKGFSQDQITQLGFDESQLDNKKLHLESILAGSERRDMIIKFLSGHIWFIFKNLSSLPFFTSDNPVAKYGHIKDDLISNEGYASPGIEINFPITPNYMLILCDREYFRNLENVENRILEMGDKENVKYHNSLQAVSCYRQVFCSSENFEILDEIYDKSPSVFDLNRKRIGGN